MKHRDKKKEEEECFSNFINEDGVEKYVVSHQSSSSSDLIAPKQLTKSHVKEREKYINGKKASFLDCMMCYAPI